MTLWSNATDRDVAVKPGPGAWFRCRRCHTRYRMIGRFVRLRTQACPGCRLRRAK